MDGVLLEADNGLRGDVDSIVCDGRGGIVRCSDVGYGAHAQCFFDDGADVREGELVSEGWGAGGADYCVEFCVSFASDIWVRAEIEDRSVEGCGGGFAAGFDHAAC